MAGMTFKVCGRQTFTFTFQEGASASSQEIVLARAIDVQAAREASILFRYHSGTNLAGCSAAVKVRSEDPSPDDPAADFLYPSPATPPNTGTTDALGTAVISGSLTAPGLVLAPVSFSSTIGGNFGSYLRCSLVVVSPTGSSIVTATIVLSVDLSLKS